MDIEVLIQARMSSRRFPGKVLAPFNGRPLIDHVVERAALAVLAQRIMVVTSIDATDDPLAAYLAGRGVRVFRGPLDDVLGRFAAAAEEIAAPWLMRICADSPLIEPSLLAFAAAAVAFDDADIVTNAYPRKTFPSGQGVEIVRRALIMDWHRRPLSPAQREHVTKAFYDCPAELRMAAIVNEALEPASAPQAVDTIADLERLSHAPANAFALRLIRPHQSGPNSAPVGFRHEGSLVSRQEADYGEGNA